VIDDNSLDELELEDALAVDALMGWDGPTCATCGAPLRTDPEDYIDGDAGLPICGDCNRAQGGVLPNSQAARAD
jgi:hypothetical protein